MLRLTLLRTRTPGKLLQIWRTSRIGPPPLLGPAFILVDIFFGDQVDRDEGEILCWLLAIDDVVPNLDRFAGHCIRILGRTSHNQAVFVFERGYHVRRSID